MQHVFVFSSPESILFIDLLLLRLELQVVFFYRICKRKTEISAHTFVVK